jgi:hypothetical protein
VSGGIDLSETVGLPDLRRFDESERFEAIFSHYLGLRIPYETVSSLEANALVREPADIAATVSDARGGHCIEHVVLLAALFREQGIQAKVATADFTNVEGGVYSPLASTFALAYVDNETWLCDPYYGAVRAKVPGHGGCLRHGVVMRRIDSDRFVYMTFEGESMYREDVVYENVDLSERVATLKGRYLEFTPFGVLSPYYQEVRPAWRALLYSPRFDRYVVQEKRSSFQMGLDELNRCEWIPDHIRKRIPAVTELNRAQRETAVRLLRRGLFNPFYVPVSDMLATRFPDGRASLDLKQWPAEVGD